MTSLALARTRLQDPHLFDNILYFCLFVGHGRSGSTLVGALLNAHPNVMMSNELDIFKYVARNVSRSQLFNLIYRTAIRQASKGSKGGGGYTYAVPNQWQGKHTKIRIIGDRKAGATAIQLFNNPALIEALKERVQTPLRFVSVVRHPFDTLATTVKMTLRLPKETEQAHVKRQIGHFLERTQAIQDVTTKFGDDTVKFVHHDQLIANPKNVLADLCEFLGLDASSQYLVDCASIINPKPHFTRTGVNWTPELIDLLRAGTSEIPWLQRYQIDRFS